MHECGWSWELCYNPLGTASFGIFIQCSIFYYCPVILCWHGEGAQGGALWVAGGLLWVGSGPHESR